MTCIIGMEWEGKVYMGADSIAMDATYDFDIIEGSKIFRKGNMLIGCAGQPRQAQIIKHHTHLPSHPTDLIKTLPGYREPTDEEYMMIFIENIRRALKEHGCLEMDNGMEAGCNLLVGYHGTLYSIENHFQLHFSKRKFLATGVGAPYAEGSLLTQIGEFGRAGIPTQMIAKALDVSARLCVGVAPPFQVEVLEA